MYIDCLADRNLTTRSTSIHACEYHCAAGAARDALRELAGISLSRSPGTPKTFPEYWLGHLEFLLANLLVAGGECENGHNG